MEKNEKKNGDDDELMKKLEEMFREIRSDFIRYPSM